MAITKWAFCVLILIQFFWRFYDEKICAGGISENLSDSDTSLATCLRKSVDSEKTKYNSIECMNKKSMHSERKYLHPFKY